MNEQENGESSKSKKIIIGLIVVSVILGIYYFNKPVVIDDKKVDQAKVSDEQPQGENKEEVSEVKPEVVSEEGKEGEEKKDVSAETIIESVEVKTGTVKKDIEQKPVDAMALVNSLISTPVAVVTMEPKKAADKAVDYVNKYIVPQEQKAKVVQVFPEKITFYRFLMDVAGQQYPSYVSIDGKTLLSAKEYDLDKNPNTIDGKEFVNIDNG